MIYFAQAGEGGPVKIGTAKNPRTRVATMRTSLPAEIKILAVMEGDGAEEAQLHKRFASTRIRGEWFSPSPDLAALIEELPPYDPASFPSPAQATKLLNEPVTPSTLKAWRKRLGWTQVQAATWFAYSLRAYENWEQGVRPIRRSAAMRELMELAEARRRRA